MAQKKAKGQQAEKAIPWIAFEQVERSKSAYVVYEWPLSFVNRKYVSAN